MIERTFSDISEGEIPDLEKESFFAGLGYSSRIDWTKLLASKRILIISEAGSGKTHECQEQCRQLQASGEASFFLELASLAQGDFKELLSAEEESRFDQWQSSQSELATIFLDSFDELKLSLGTFENALRKLSKLFRGRLERVRIIVTTRPIPYDQEVMQRFLPVPEDLEMIEPSSEAFAQIALHGEKKKGRGVEATESAPDWRTVALHPFSDQEIIDFARLQGVSNPEELFEDLKSRNAEQFARRPQDLIELSADWKDHKRIRTHREQVEGNIRVKLKPRTDRCEVTELSIERAIDGASKLALAMMFSRRLTIRHSAESDKGGTEAAFDPALVLPDWNQKEIKALLERPLFGFASYGRVRFHHRSVMEFLASERLRVLRANGMPTKALKRLIFVETKGKLIVRHSKRPIAGWLALFEPTVFETLRDNEPDVLLDEGDPQSLTVQQRVESLRAFTLKHSSGGWRGLRVPIIQIHRFASTELSAEIANLWWSGIENLEVRELLLQIIEVGKVKECADIAFQCASDTQLELGERLGGIDALIALNDERLEAFVTQIVEESSDETGAISRAAATRLFPQHMSIPQMLEILSRLERSDDLIDELLYYVFNTISDTVWAPEDLAKLRDGVVSIILEDLCWQKKRPHFDSCSSHLEFVLTAICVKGLKQPDRSDYLTSSTIACLVMSDDHDSQKIRPELFKVLNDLPAELICRLFWEADSFIQGLGAIVDPWNRFYEATFHWHINLYRERDFPWIEKCLSDRNRSEEQRAVILEAACRLGPDEELWFDHMEGLKALVSDIPPLVRSIDEKIEKSKQRPDDKWEKTQAMWKAKNEKKEAKDLASWVQFWAEIVNNTEKAFSDDNEENTAWNLWRVMIKTGKPERQSGWNRHFIEVQFGKEVADQLRLALMRQWRDDTPTLVSERPADKKGTYLMRWTMGVAAIYAESEDPEWAEKLSADEVSLAARYATIELNSLPTWVESLAKVHPVNVEEILGKELETEFNSKAGEHFHSMLLQKISQSSDLVNGLFLPRMRIWLDERLAKTPAEVEQTGETERLSQVTRFLERHGDEKIGSYLCSLAAEQLADASVQSPSPIWLPILIKYDPPAGLKILENRIESVKPSQSSEAVSLLGSLFGDRLSRDGINFVSPLFTPGLLLRLMRLLYKHVRVEDDVHRTNGRAYTPDERDNAEGARNRIVNILLASKGEDGWAIKLEMASDPHCAHFKDRIVAMAEESWAEEVDSESLNDHQITSLNKSGEVPPATSEAMFALLVDRLEDIDELLLQDVSPWESWAGIKTEKVMRREISRELRTLSGGLYTVDQESVTADEKETDIRLRSTVSSHEAVIELKLADRRPLQDLLGTIEDQLVEKYMASEKSRSGCLLVTLAKDRKWNNPDGGRQLEFSEVIELLQKKAEEVETAHHQIFRLYIHSLDLRPRLRTEARIKKY